MAIIRFLFLIFLLVFEAVFVSFAIFILISGLISQAKGALYVPISRKYLKDILKFSELKEASSFYDLGSGDGRVLIESVLNFRIKKAVGYEVSPWPYLKARFLIRRFGLKNKIDIFRQDFLRVDLREADNVFLYLFPKIVQKLAPKFKGELSSGSKIISVSFPINEPEKFNLQLIKTGKIDRFNLFVYQKI